MSLLEVGARCTACNLIDFLPFTCPNCHDTFCKTHIHSHLGCSPAPIEGQKEYYEAAGPSSWASRMRCDVKGCEKMTIEAVGGYDISTSSTSGDVEIARQVRCPGCQRSFCVSHRQQSQHDCTGPADHTARQEVSLIRKAKAAEIIAKNFPDHAGKIIPKPPPPKDVVRHPPTLQSSPKVETQSPPASVAAPAKTVTKTKAEKLHEIHIRKIKSLAEPLIPNQLAQGGDKRYFEWCKSTPEKVTAWMKDGKLDGKLERVWVKLDTPVGKVLDQLISTTKTPRPSSEKPEESLKLLCLSSLPDQPRAVIPLNTSQSVGSTVVEASIVCLVKGWNDTQ